MGTVGVAITDHHSRAHPCSLLRVAMTHRPAFTGHQSLGTSHWSPITGDLSLVTSRVAVTHEGPDQLPGRERDASPLL